MRVFMTLRDDGCTVKGFYSEDIYGEYPAPGYPENVIEITEDQWQDYRDHQGFRKWDASSKTFIATEPPTEPPAPPVVSGDAIISVLTNAQVVASAKDVARISWREDVPSTNNKLVRIAKALGTDPDTLRAQALSA